MPTEVFCIKGQNLKDIEPIIVQVIGHKTETPWKKKLTNQ